MFCAECGREWFNGAPGAVVRDIRQIADKAWLVTRDICESERKAIEAVLVAYEGGR